MANSNGTPRAVVLAALLHILIVAFLALNIMPCSKFEEFYAWAGLPASLNPLKCPAPIQLPGQIIDAVLVGPTGAPPPKATKVTKPVPDTTPPPPTATPPPTPPPPTPPKLETLPPVPKQPDTKDQEKVVQDALIKAEDAKHEQEEKQRQRQAEIDAEAKAQKQKEVDDIFAKLDAAKAQRQKLENNRKQAEQQLKDLANAKPDGRADLPPADQVQTGNNGPDTGLLGQYLAAVQNAVTTNWLRPDNMPNASCVVHIIQLPGGQVMSAKADASCPYDEAGRRSIENAVLRAQPLPYQGYESVFQRNLDFTFRP